MADAAIYAGLTEVFHEVFGDDRLVLDAATAAESVPGWDSIRMVSIVLAVEQHFGVRLRSREVDKLRNVGDLAELVRIKTAATSEQSRFLIMASGGNDGRFVEACGGGTDGDAGARRARGRSRSRPVHDSSRNAALHAAAAALRDTAGLILDANARDLEACADGSAAFRGPAGAEPARLEAMAAGLEAIASLPDPVGRVLAEWDRPNGLRLRRVATPIGVIGMIYESRPNVGADAAGLCLKSGNAVLLRGGSESLHSARAIHAAMQAGLRHAGLPEAAVQMAPDADRVHVAAMLGAAGLIDLIIPRGGRSLVERVQREARVPVLAHAEGLCHTYVDASADPAMALDVLANAKMRRTGVCGATETLLIDRAIARAQLPGLIDGLRALGCDFRADAAARAIVADLRPADADSFDTEWQDAVLSVAVVDGVDGALAHIARHSSSHTEAIIAGDAVVADKFLGGTDSAVVMWNASTQFCDGGEFGFGAEIGISTGRLHARGPVGLEQLASFRYEVIGTGQTRP